MAGCKYRFCADLLKHGYKCKLCAGTGQITEEVAKIMEQHNKVDCPCCQPFDNEPCMLCDDTGKVDQNTAKAFLTNQHEEAAMQADRMLRIVSIPIVTTPQVELVAMADDLRDLADHIEAIALEGMK